MNSKVIFVLFVNFLFIIQIIKCEEITNELSNNETISDNINKTVVSIEEDLTKINETNGEREPKQEDFIDLITGAIGAAAAGAIDAVSSSVVRGVLGSETQF